MTYRAGKKLMNKAAGPSSPPPLGLAYLVENNLVYRARAQEALDKYQVRIRALRAALEKQAENEAVAGADGTTDTDTQASATQAGATEVAQEGCAHVIGDTVTEKDIGGEEKSSNNIRVPQALDAAQE